MLTDRVATWIIARVAPSPWTETTQALIKEYAGASRSERRIQQREVALIVAHGLVMIPFILLVALAGGLATRLGSPAPTDAIQRVGIAGLAWCITGVVLHLGRYCLGWVTLSRADAQHSDGSMEGHWPRRSSDLDFLAQTLVAIVVGLAA